IKEGMEHDHSDHDHSDHDHRDGKYDEHVWTSPKNAALIVQDIRDAMVEQFPESADSIKANADEYIAKLGELDGRFESLFEGCELCLIFGDRFPLRYFVERYGIDYYAAFPGCSADSEASASTVAFLINKIKEIGAPTVFYIEFSNHVIADSIAESTGVGKAQFNTCHNVSKKQLDDGATYLSLMEENYRTMEKYIAQIGG
ncbi:MAG: zinc ABC transporter substrate-binding protein, partial [Clostridia bacterium]|nr:zinc ABC transporter substrate-binding protein [Clostridia bacterium]